MINRLSLLAVLASSLLISCIESPIQTKNFGNSSKVGKYINIRGINMYYETYGNGEPLLLIHGNSGSIVSFRYQIPYFSKKYKVIVADSRSQGKSVDVGDSLSYEMMADDFGLLLDSLRIDSCFVIGWSDGGINGLLLAIRHPEKVKKLAISGANLWPDTTAIDKNVWNRMKGTITIDAQGKYDAEKKNRLKLTNLMLKEPNIPIWYLKKIGCPTLVIGGDHDAILPKHTLLIAESIPKSYLWILPNSGHSILINQKDEFNKVVNEFFQKPYERIEGRDRLFK